MSVHDNVLLSFFVSVCVLYRYWRSECKHLGGSSAVKMETALLCIFSNVGKFAIHDRKKWSWKYEKEWKISYLGNVLSMGRVCEQIEPKATCDYFMRLAVQHFQLLPSLVYLSITCRSAWTELWRRRLEFNRLFLEIIFIVFEDWKKSQLFVLCVLYTHDFYIFRKISFYYLNCNYLFFKEVYFSHVL